MVEKKTLKELRHLCKQKNLPTSGNKDVLIQKLKKSEAAGGTQNVLTKKLFNKSTTASGVIAHSSKCPFCKGNKFFVQSRDKLPQDLLNLSLLDGFKKSVED
eukprot:Trichotokara_eunicae@DN10048_c0_g1_i1.p1